MANFHPDLTGQRFGRLTVIGYAGTNKRQDSMWRVRCDCGNEKVVLALHMKGGRSKSCGSPACQKVMTANHEPEYCI